MTEKDQRILEALQAVAARSDAMVEWALLVVAGSIAAIVSTSYIRPQVLRPRLIYLLFIPAWLALAVSLYFGDQVARRHLAEDRHQHGILTPRDRGDIHEGVEFL